MNTTFDVIILNVVILHFLRMHVVGQVCKFYIKLMGYFNNVDKHSIKDH